MDKILYHNIKCHHLSLVSTLSSLYITYCKYSNMHISILANFLFPGHAKDISRVKTQCIFIQTDDETHNCNTYLSLCGKNNK